MLKPCFRSIYSSTAEAPGQPFTISPQNLLSLIRCASRSAATHFIHPLGQAERRAHHGLGRSKASDHCHAAERSATDLASSLLSLLSNLTLTLSFSTSNPHKTEAQAVIPKYLPHLLATGCKQNAELRQRGAFCSLRWCCEASLTPSLTMTTRCLLEACSVDSTVDSWRRLLCEVLRVTRMPGLSDRSRASLWGQELQ